MPHWRSFTDRGDFIYSYDLGGKDRTLTIERVVAGTVVGQKGKKTKKPVVYFKESKADENGTKKGLALNATNGKSVAALYGNDTDGWIGKRVTLYTTTTEMDGETVECIRIRKQIPQGKDKPAEPTETEPTEPREPGAEG